MRFQLSLLSLSILLWLSCGAWTSIIPEPVKVVYFAGKPIVMGQINGKDAFFLIDTGSDVSILHTRMAKSYGYRVSTRTYRRPIHGIQGQQAYIKLILDAQLKLGTYQLEASFKGLDLSTLATSIKQKTSLQIAGILGADFLMKYGFNINFYQRTITYIPPQPDKPKEVQQSPALVEGL